MVTKEFRHVVMIPVGLDTIGSVVFEDKFKKVVPSGTVQVGKSEKLGHFAYGGSSVITLIAQGIKSISIPQGQQIGVFQSKESSKKSSLPVHGTDNAALKPVRSRNTTCNPCVCFSLPGSRHERPVSKIVVVGMGHFAGRHELLLYGVELERRKADCGGDLQCVS